MSEAFRFYGKQNVPVSPQVDPVKARVTSLFLMGEKLILVLIMQRVRARHNNPFYKLNDVEITEICQLLRVEVNIRRAKFAVLVLQDVSTLNQFILFKQTLPQKLICSFLSTKCQLDL